MMSSLDEKGLWHETRAAGCCAGAPLATLGQRYLGVALVLCPDLPSRFTLLFYPKSTVFCFFLLAFFSTLLAVFSFSFLHLFGITTGLRTPIRKHPPSHEENNVNYEEEPEVADVFDSDFDEDEPEPDEEVENDADERFRTKKRLIFPGKPSMKKKKVLSNLDGDSKDENLTQKTSSTQHHDAPDDAEGERIIRKSTRTSVIVRQAERDAIRAALQATMKATFYGHLHLFSPPFEIVLSGFAAADEQLRLTTMVFKNIFPDIDINTKEPGNEGNEKEDGDNDGQMEDSDEDDEADNEEDMEESEED
ncbi:hypothetical protein GOBAR_DD15766 [Gossypium barbadense]|nr:hypothetical protein GOBAR_DD15766 [Gossypium barbadense]